MEILTSFLYIVFVLAAIILIVVILLQEGKGGGFGQFLGEGGQQTFGVGAKGINTFTGYVAASFIVCAILLNILNRGAGTGSVTDGMDPAFGATNERAMPGVGMFPGDTGGGGGFPGANVPPGGEPSGG